MFCAVKKSVDAERAAAEKLAADRKKRDAQAAANTAEWMKILPQWEKLSDSWSTRRLWARGLPPKVRGRVWELSVGNRLGITEESYSEIVARISTIVDVNLELDQQRPDDPSEEGGEPEKEPEYGSVEYWARHISTDLPRTHAVLAFFHKEGPLRRPLHEVLLAYAVYRPDIGYVQGMSYIVAMLLLQLPTAYQAFKTLANMIEVHPHMSAFLKMDMKKINYYLHDFNIVLQKRLPKLHHHFFSLEVSVDPVIIDWLMTIFSKSVSLDISVRIWDQFMRDGLAYLFKASIGMLKVHEERLLAADFDECMTILTRQLKDIDIDTAFCMEVIDEIPDTPSPDAKSSLEKMLNSMAKPFQFAV